MKKSGILIFLIMGCLIHGLGQETLRFHSDPALFVLEARAFFGEGQPERSRAILQKYEYAQKKGLLEENQWIDLAKKANTIEKLGAPPFPDFYTLLESYLEITTHVKNQADYFTWSAQLDKLLTDDKRSLNLARSFLDFSLAFSQKGILFKSPACQWKVSAGQNEFGKDSLFYVVISSSNLVASASGDSTVIFSTRGKYYPESHFFSGQGGRITWEKLKIQADQVYVNLNDYSLNLSKSVYSIDSVNLIDKRYFTEPLIGQVENKILPGVSADVAGYPRFTSYELRNRIKNIYPGMDFEGGFSLQGLKVIGTGLPSQKGILTIYRSDKPIMRLACTHFTFKPDQARGINAEASIYLETDSIYHPGLSFQYNSNLKEISLIRDGQGLSPSRYLNYYHGYDLDAGWIRWRLGDSFMTISGLPGSTENRASFESSDFFNMDRFNEILIADKVHPVSAVKQCADHYYSRDYTLADLSTFMGKPQHLVEEMLLKLSFYGFVRYNPETRLINVQERAYDFLKKNAGLQDYDIIRFESVQPPEDENALLDLNTNHLKVFSIKSIVLSQTRNVIIYPTNSTIEILKGKDILFDGEIQGGLVHFSGKQFHFTYDDFSILLKEVDMLKIQVFEKPLKKDTDPLLADVTSVIENTRGVLKIDEPSNKSGLKAEDFPEYPILQTDTNAFVYYDQKEILNGIYPRKTFNFNISPFTLRGLNLYTFSDSLIFPGRFMTADIFPPLELALRHQSDHSLGFETLKTPKQGLPVYQGKGTFFNNLAMSRAGLKGSGKLEYLNSVLESEDFLFLPDQVNTVARLSVIKDTVGTGNPATQGEQMAVRWSPENENLVAQSTKGPLNMYGNGQFNGALSLDPNDLTAKGTLLFDGYSITSNEFVFYKDSYEVKNGVLKIFADSAARTADPALSGDAGLFFVGNQINGQVKVDQKKAHFEPAGKDSRMEFTQNQFIGLPKSVDWDLSTRRITMDDVILSMASKPGDSLNFKSRQTEFTLANQTVQAHQVEYIDVADVRVFPKDQNLIIRKNARIDSLMQATIVSRDTSLVHRITEATITITDHRKYHARGFYQYTDIAKRDFPIEFSDIQPDKNGVSLGKGMIPIQGDFGLSPAFRYIGSVEWNNNERYLLFDGQAQFSHACPNITRQWIQFTSRIYPDSVSIPIDSITVNHQNERLFKGFFLSNQPVELYSTFVGPHTRYSDQPLISAYGTLWFDEEAKKYKLTSFLKEATPEADGTILTLNVNDCITEAQGPINLGVDLGQVKLLAAGKMSHDLTKDTVTASMILTSDFFFDSDILNYMAKSINGSNGLEPVNYSDPEFREAFKNLLGGVKAGDLLKQLSLYGKWRKVPDELLHTLVFSDVRFNWNPETGSYQSTGKIGLCNVLDESVNKKLNGYIEILHRRGGDTFTVYLEVDRQKYFFFNYSRGVMQCVAGPGFEKFNTMIRSAKEGKRTQKTQPGESGYQYYIGTYSQVASFLRKFNVER